MSKQIWVLIRRFSPGGDMPIAASDDFGALVGVVEAYKAGDRVVDTEKVAVTHEVRSVDLLAPLPDPDWNDVDAD